jgi:hypothetical protein
VDWQVRLSILFGILCLLAVVSLGSASHPHWQGEN